MYLMSVTASRVSTRISTVRRRWAGVGLGAILLFSFASVADGQHANVIISALPGSPNRISIEGVRAPTRIWSFRNEYAGVSELGNRIEALKVFDSGGAEISVSKIAPGQFETATAASKFRYEVNLTPPAKTSDTARVSWLTAERGVLMLADLLPVPGPALAGESKGNARESATVRFKLPDSWAVYSNEREIAKGEFEIADLGSAVFSVGTRLRTSHITIGGMAFDLVTEGEWAFSDSDALKLGADILKLHQDVFGSMSAKRGTLILIPFPQTVAANKWTAETRGSTVTLLMGRLASKTAALLQLSVPLTHELFHLWVPNGLALNGDYDWFYEGFTVYQAARTSEALGLLTFQEFLNAIARAYDAYVAGVDHDRWSLIEASKRRWTVGEPSVYSKSMVIAFLYDLKLRSETHGKHSLVDAYRRIFQSARTAQGMDGNDAVTSALAVDSQMQDFVRQFISAPVSVNLAQELAPFGLQVEVLGFRRRINVSEQLRKPQRDLLRELGYNDSSRSPSQKKRN